MAIGKLSALKNPAAITRLSTNNPRGERGEVDDVRRELANCRRWLRCCFYVKSEVVRSRSFLIARLQDANLAIFACLQSTAFNAFAGIVVR